MNIKDRLIKLGSENPELQEYLRPIIDRVSAMGYEHDPRPDTPEELKKALLDEGWEELFEPKQYQDFGWDVRKHMHKIRWFPHEGYEISKIIQHPEKYGEVVMESDDEEKVYHYAARKI